jgi:16S rRNA C967 or C1407 C5-methylase (RsmB/RsmF family)
MTHNIDSDKRKYAEARRSAGLAVPEREAVRIERAKKISHQLADQTAKKQAESEARRKYHAAWQEYYQKYYEHYYLAQLEIQRRDLTKSWSDQKELSPRQRAIEDLRKELLQKISDQAGKVKKSRHFKPIAAGVVVVLLAVFVQYNQLFAAGLHGIISPSSDQSSLIDGSLAAQAAAYLLWNKTKPLEAIATSLAV